VEHEVLGGGGDGIPEFCNIHIGDAVKVTYFEMPKVNYIMATIGNPKEIFFNDFWRRIFFEYIWKSNVSALEMGRSKAFKITR
jgi:galactokinase/mevalonate kinase-like predicted kinase